MADAFPSEADQATATALVAPGLSGHVLHLICYGMIVREVFDYTTSHSYRSDKRALKAFMWTVLTLETVSVGFNVFQLHNFSSNQHRDADSLLSATIIDNIAPLPVGAIAALVQGYLLSRAAKLFRSTWAWAAYVSLVGLPLCVGLIGSLWTTVAGVEYLLRGADTVGGISYNVALAMWQWSSAFVDVTISLTLAVMLRNHIAGFNQHTDTVIRSLITLGLRTGSYTSILAVAGAVTATAFPGLSLMTTNIPETFWVPLSGLYTLSLMATLSSRAALRTNLTAGGGVVSSVAAHAHQQQRNTVKVELEVATAYDVRRMSRDEDDFGRPRLLGVPGSVGRRMSQMISFERSTASAEGEKEDAVVDVSVASVV